MAISDVNRDVLAQAVRRYLEAQATDLSTLSRSIVDLLVMDDATRLRTLRPLVVAIRNDIVARRNERPELRAAEDARTVAALAEIEDTIANL